MSSGFWRLLRTGSLRIRPASGRSWTDDEPISADVGCVIRNENAAVQHWSCSSQTKRRIMLDLNDDGHDGGQQEVKQCPHHGQPKAPKTPYYCTQCSQFACHLCVEENTHLGHGLRLLKEAAADQQRCLQRRLKMLAKQMDAMQACKDEMDAFERSYTKTKQMIRSHTKELVRKLQEHEDRLLKEAADIHDATLNQLNLSRQEVEQNLLTLEILRRRVQTVVEERPLANNDPAEYLLKHKRVLSKLTNFENLFSQAEVQLPAIDFHPIRCNTTFGSVTTLSQDNASGSPVNSNSRSSVSLPSSPQHIYIYAKKRVGSVHIEQPSKVRLASPRNPAPPLPTVADRSQIMHVNGPLESPPQPAYVQPMPPPPLKDCNFKLACNKSLPKEKIGRVSEAPVRRTKCLWKLTEEGSAPGQIRCPSDVAFLFDGSVVIADRDNSRIQVFDGQGNFVKIIQSARFKPCRLAVMRNGNIAVTDVAESCIKVFDLSGMCVATWGKKWYKNIFKSPCGIAISSQQQVIVSDMERHTVSVFTPEGKLLRNLQCTGHSDFHSPAYLACDSKDRVIVADNWQQCVKVFDDTTRHSFQFHRTLASAGDDTCLEYPNGVCADENDCIYVADWGTHCVSKFTSEGTFIEHVLTREDGLNHPAGVAVMNNCLVVTAYCDSHSSVALYSMAN